MDSATFLEYRCGRQGKKLIVIPTITFISVDEHSETGYYYIGFSGGNNLLLLDEKDMPLENLKEKIQEYWSSVSFCSGIATHASPPR